MGGKLWELEMAKMVLRSDDRFLTIAEYCERFKRSRASFYRDKEAGRIRVVKLGGSPRIVEREVLELLARGASDV